MNNEMIRLSVGVLAPEKSTVVDENGQAIFVERFLNANCIVC